MSLSIGDGKIYTKFRPLLRSKKSLYEIQNLESDEVVSSSSSPSPSVACRVKYLVDTPAIIKGYLDKSMFLESAIRFMTVNFVHSCLDNNYDSKNLPEWNIVESFQSVSYHKLTASGVLQWMKGKGFNLILSNMKKNLKSPCAQKFPHVKHFKCKTVAKKPRRMKVNTTTTIARVAGLDLPVLDEEYNEDDMAYLRAQRLHEVKVVDNHLKVDNHLEVRYLDGRERTLNLALIECLHTYDLERIMALLKCGVEDERACKIEIASILKERNDQEEELKKRNEELKRMREQELEEMEAKAQELREKGLCRAEYNPYVVEYNTLTDRHVKIRMDHLSSYPELSLRIVAEELRGSPPQR